MIEKETWICDLTAIEINQLVRDGKVTPLDVIDQTFKRIHLLNPVINAFIFLCEAQARQEALLQTRLLSQGVLPGPLWGVPIGVKDLEDVEGLPTSFGALLYQQKQRPAARSSAQVRRLQQAGAIVVGKTNTPLFGSKATSHNRPFGASLNPFDLSKTPGGSSGGSAAAVSARLVPIATGSDGGGSVRIPAALSGCFGLKPTVGLIPINDMTSFSAETWSRVVHYGPLTRSVADAALFLDIAAGYDPSDPHSFPKPCNSFLDALRVDSPASESFSFDVASHTACSSEVPALSTISDTDAFSSAISAAALSPSEEIRPLRIAFSRNLGYIDNVWPDVESAVRSALETFRKEERYFSVTEIDQEFTDICTAWVTLLGSEQKALLSTDPEIQGGLDQLEKSFVAMWDAMDVLGLPDLANVYRQRFALSRELEALFSKFDLLITPTMPVTGFPPTGPMPMDGFSSPLHPAAGFTIPFNFSGHPAASIRCGFSSDGLPIGMQIVAPRHHDHLVLQVANYFEKKTRCYDKWPNVSELAQQKINSKL